MTEPEKPRVLFLDDDIGDPSAATVNAALEALSKQFDVKAVKTLAQASEEFYKHAYAAFVLDIDMRHANDTVTPTDRRGSWLAQTMRSLSADTAVIMFSNMGEVPDWIQVANHHVYGYIDKSHEQSVEHLIAMVGKVIASPPVGWQSPQSRSSGSVLVYRSAACSVEQDQIEKAVSAAGDFEPKFLPLDKLASALTSKLPDGVREVAAVLIVADELDTRPSTMSNVDLIGSVGPSPNTVYALRMEKGHLPTVLRVINSQPFRLLNLNDIDIETALTDAIRLAAYWYGGNELFASDDEAYRAATQRIDWAALGAGLLSDEADDGELDFDLDAEGVN